MVDSVILCILSYEVLDFTEVSLYEWSRYHAQRYCQHLLEGRQCILADTRHLEGWASCHLHIKGTWSGIAEEVRYYMYHVHQY